MPRAPRYVVPFRPRGVRRPRVNPWVTRIQQGGRAVQAAWNVGRAATQAFRPIYTAARPYMTRMMRAPRGKKRFKRRGAGKPGYNKKTKFCAKVEKCISDGTPNGHYINVIDKTLCQDITQSVDSLQPNNVKTWEEYKFLDPKLIDDRIAFVYPTVNTGALQREQVHIVKWSQSRTFTNYSQLDMKVSFYEYSPVSTSSTPLLTRFQNAITDLEGASSISIRAEGITPGLVSHEMRQYFKQVKVKTIVLKPGKSHTYTIAKNNFQFDFNDVDLAIADYFSNFGRVLVVSLQMQTTSDGNTYPYPDGTLRCRGFENFVVRCPNAVPDADSIEVLDTNRFTTSNYATVGSPVVTQWSHANPADILATSAAAQPATG